MIIIYSVYIHNILNYCFQLIFIYLLYIIELMLRFNIKYHFKLGI